MGIMKEIEIKFPLLNSDEVISFLKKNAKLKYENRQVDKYYDLPHRSFVAEPNKIREWLRLRDSDGKKSFNYKIWNQVNDVEKAYADEYETKIESIEVVEAILKAIDIKPLIVVDKQRQVWDFKDVEVNIDRVVDLGDFIELEYEGEIEDVMEVRKMLYNMIDELGAKTGKQDTRGYPYELLIKKGAINFTKDER